nr:tetratricopeptide repeat protein [Pontibaca salina]
MSQPDIGRQDAGAYLAGRQAVYGSDYAVAAQYYARALMRDSGNPDLMENLVLSQLSLGQVARALPVAKRMEDLGVSSQAAHMVVAGNLIADEDFAALLSRDAQIQSIGPLVDGLVLAWAHMGAGSVAQALEQFDKVAEDNGLQGFAHYHKAMALASVGDYEGAEALFAADEGALGMVSRRAAMARAEILSLLGRNADALAIIKDSFGTDLDPALDDLAERLRAGEQVPFSHVRSVRDGMAEVFLTLAQALAGEAADPYALIYARMAEFLRPDNIDALLMTADLLDRLGQYDLAEATFAKVPNDHPSHFAAELGRAESLRRAGRPEAAIEALKKLAAAYPDLAPVQTALGDLQRQQENYADAISAYDHAIDHSEANSSVLWFLHYARGISHERLGQWDSAEVDFRRALELNPDQPQVLNYLGYSLVEQQAHLDEALDMIERAVAAEPDSGYIVDSLGWALFRLRRYDEAVGHMETAVQLMPVDPVVNDHLGDVYWAVGRIREAEFQWKRALSFVDPEEKDAEADPDRIRRKLEIGLNAVLAEEGAEPLKLRDEDG